MATSAPNKRAIFRSKALEKYVQSREKSVLPRFVAPPVFALSWLVLVALTAAGLIAWLGQVPLYATGSGLVLDQSATSPQGNDEAVAVILLPAASSMHLRTGLSVQVQIGVSGPLVTSTIDSIEPTILSPNEVRQRYMFEVLDPSFVAIVRLGPHISSHMYAGSIVHAQIQVGSQRLLSLFPPFNTTPS
ncbi:MAG: hypothetical protein JO202_18265 [Ktedonobacteraceae bacterium]|nr:hypothetical protein [Ktedonobacteraceae bacterium]